MKQKMNKMQEDINRSRPQPQPEPSKSKDIEGEYIDYEEIR